MAHGDFQKFPGNLQIQSKIIDHNGHPGQGRSQGGLLGERNRLGRLTATGFRSQGGKMVTAAGFMMILLGGAFGCS